MNKIVVLWFATLILFGCTKEPHQTAPTLVGKWQFKEARTSPGDLSIITNTASAQPAHIEFWANGTFTAEATSDYGLFKNFSHFDRYEIISDNTIRLYKSSNGESVTAYYSFEEGLVLQYGVCREYCADRFVRTH